MQPAVDVRGRCSMRCDPRVTTHVVVEPDKHDVGGVLLTDKVRCRLRVLCRTCCCCVVWVSAQLHKMHVASNEWVR
jgi:hypothetical protein